MQKYVNLVDLFKGYLTSISLQESVSIQPRTSFSGFGCDSIHSFNSLLSCVGCAAAKCTRSCAPACIHVRCSKPSVYVSSPVLCLRLVFQRVLPCMQRGCNFLFRDAEGAFVLNRAWSISSLTSGRGSTWLQPLRVSFITESGRLRLIEVGSMFDVFGVSDELLIFEIVRKQAR